MTWKKRIISIALCLCALLCAASVRAEAADAATTHTDHPICGNTHTNVGDHTSDNCSTPTWTAWNGGTIPYDANNVAYISLSQDVTLPNFLTIANGKTLYFCLNGHNLKMSRNRVIDIDGGTFILCNCKDTGAITQADNNSKGMGVGLSNNGTFTMYGGSITGNKGGVNVGSGCTFTMYGGSITQNAAGDDSGGGVYVYSAGTFAMHGGTISNNSGNNGGGVYVKSNATFTMSGGTIINNTAAESDGGGGVYNQGTFTMSDGEISGNTTTFGGGVRNYGTFTMSGGTITGNTAANNGGGVNNYNGTFNISGNVTITGNKKGSVANNVYLPAGSTITLAGALGENASIHVTTSKTPSSSPYYVDITAANSNKDLVTAAKGKFVYDNSSSSNPIEICTYTVTEDEITTVQLRACKHNYNNVKWTPNTDASTGHWRKCKNCDKTQTAAHTEAIDAAVEPTCTATGLTEGKHCSVCGAVIVAQTTVPAKAHDWGTQWISDDSDKNHHWHKCNNCNAIDTTSKAPHDWNSGKVTTPATCTTDGVKTLTCTACSVTKIETIDASGHDFSVRRYDENNHWLKCSRCDAIDAKAAHSGGTASCTEKAKCEVCGQPHGDLKAHDFANGPYQYDGQQHWKKCANCDATDTKEAHSGGTASCTKKAECSVCGQEYGGLKAHDFENGPYQYDGQQHWKKCANCDATDTKEAHSGGTASCTAKAKCSVCGQEYGGYAAHVYDTTKWVNGDSDKDHHWHECTKCHEKKDLTEHTWDDGEVTTPATCTADGVKTLTCTACSATKTEPVPASGHDLVHHEAKAATCTAVGWDAYDTCRRCDYTTYVEKPASGHDLVHHEAKAATCTAIGWDAYDTCTRCDYTTYVEKSALGHDFTVPKYDEIQHWYKCANCTATTEPVAHTDFTAWKSDRSGHWHECSTCGYKTAVTAHTPDRDKATETEAKVCKDCDWVIAPATHPVHTWVLVAETPATCNATGVKEHYNCTCGRTSFKNGDAYDINEDAKVLTIEKNSANHTGAPDSKWLSDSENHWQEYTCCHARANEAAHSGGAATCTAQAICQVCGRAYGPLAAHAWQPATCTAPKTCSVCHTTEGAALAHDWGAWEVTTPATKDAPGVETRTCAHNSAHTETRSIPKLSTTVYTVSEDTKIAQIEAKVDGLDKILESNENKALVNNGKSVGVSLTVKNTASSGVSEKIKEKLAGSNLVGLRLELTVEKTVTANGVVESKQTIPDTGVLLKTTITLPAELQGKSGYVVYRLHGDAVHVLTETPNENGEFITVSADKTQITICARLYSEYVIAYQTGGSSGGGYHPVNPTPVKATSANTGDAGVLLYGVTAALSLTGTAWLGAKSRKH